MMRHVAGLVLALMVSAVYAGKAEAAIQFFLDTDFVDETGGSFTVSGAASGVPSHSIDVLVLDLRFSDFQGVLDGSLLTITSSTGHSGLNDGVGAGVPGDYSDGDTLLRTYSAAPTMTLTNAKTPLASFSFTGPGGLFLAGSGFTVSLDSALSTPLLDPNTDYLTPAPLQITAVPEPGTVAALACLAAGTGFGRWSSRRRARAAVSC